MSSPPFQPSVEVRRCELASPGGLGWRPMTWWQGEGSVPIGIGWSLVVTRTCHAAIGTPRPSHIPFGDRGPLVLLRFSWPEGWAPRRT